MISRQHQTTHTHTRNTAHDGRRRWLEGNPKSLCAAAARLAWVLSGIAQPRACGGLAGCARHVGQLVRRSVCRCIWASVIKSRGRKARGAYLRMRMWHCAHAPLSTAEDAQMGAGGLCMCAYRDVLFFLFFMCVCVCACVHARVMYVCVCARIHTNHSFLISCVCVCVCV